MYVPWYTRKIPISVMLVGSAPNGIKILRTKGEYSVVFLQLPIVIFCKHCSHTLLLFQDLPGCQKHIKKQDQLPIAPLKHDEIIPAIEHGHHKKTVQRQKK